MLGCKQDTQKVCNRYVFGSDVLAHQILQISTHTLATNTSMAFLLFHLVKI